MSKHTPALHITQSSTARVIKIGEDSWHLEIPASRRPGYCLAQLDDDGSLKRSDFLWRPPCTLSLQARVSANDIPGTWGFGVWNDPFSFLIGSGGVHPRLPTLPDAVWFFHASPQNYLSFRDDLPANGYLAATFSSKKVPAVLLALASPALALSLFPATTQVLRRLLRRLIQQDASQIHTDVTEWHGYTFEWKTNQVRFSLDGIEFLRTNICPKSPLSLVIWVDNQYAALPSKGRLKYGTLPNPEISWMEIRGLELVSQT